MISYFKIIVLEQLLKCIQVLLIPDMKNLLFLKSGKTGSCILGVLIGNLG